jgi:hypothetical protein
MYIGWKRVLSLKHARSYWPASLRILAPDDFGGETVSLEICLSMKLTTHTFRSALLTALLFIGTAPLYAQWVKTSGPDNVRTLFTSGGATVYAGTRAGVFRTSDSGMSWTGLNNGLTHTNVRSILLRSGMIFVGTEGGGIFRSMNSGASWAPVNNGLAGLDVRALAFSRNQFFAGTNNGVFRSADSGASWTSFNMGLASTNISALVAHPFNSDLYAGSDSGVFRGTSDTSAWGALNVGLSSLDVRALGHIGNVFCAGTASGISFWEFGLTPWSWHPSHGASTTQPRAFAGSRGIPDATLDVIFAATAGGILMSEDFGQNWDTINHGLTNPDMQAVATNDITLPFGYLFAGSNGGVWRRPVSEVIPLNIRSKTSSRMDFQGDATGLISFTLQSAETVSLIAFNLAGEKEVVLIAGHLPQGVHKRRISLAELGNGFYVFRLRVGNVSESKRLVLAR